MPLTSRIFRLIIVGATGVGKTALVEQLIFGNHVIGFSGPNTLGDIYEALIESEPSNAEAVQIYDTPGKLFTTELAREPNYDQEHYLSIGDGFVLVYDIASKTSFDLVKLLRQKITIRHKECPVVVVGNKYDLDGIRQVQLDKALEWAKVDGVHLYETSVLDRESLREPFSYIAWLMANPGKPVPAHFQSSLSHHSTTRKSFTIPQTRSRHRHHGNDNLLDQPLLSPTGTPPPSVAKGDTPPPSLSPPQTIAHSKGSSTSIKSNDLQSSSPQMSSANSDYSVDSRISSRHVYPEDALYPKGGLFGLADCMSSRSRERK